MSLVKKFFDGMSNTFNGISVHDFLNHIKKPNITLENRLKESETGIDELRFLKELSKLTNKTDTYLVRGVQRKQVDKNNFSDYEESSIFSNSASRIARFKLIFNPSIFIREWYVSLTSRIFGSKGEIGVLDHVFKKKGNEDFATLLHHEGGKFVFVQKGTSGNHDVRVTYYIVSPRRPNDEYSILTICKNLKNQIIHADI